MGLANFKDINHINDINIMEENCQMLVKHEINTDKECKSASSWIEYWKEQLEQELPDKCPCCGKDMTNEKDSFVGAHVYNSIYIRTDKHQLYIVPTCSSCNSKYGKGKEVQIVPFPVPCNYLAPDEE